MIGTCFETTLERLSCRGQYLAPAARGRGERVSGSSCMLPSGPPFAWRLSLSLAFYCHLHRLYSNGKKYIFDWIQLTVVTFRFGRLVVVFAKQFLVLHQVELVTGVELATTDYAGEAVHVIDIFLSPTHDVRGRNVRSTRTAFRTKFPVKLPLL